MSEAIKIEGHTLICDVSGCGHEEPISPPYQAKVGAPCPKCGADLLTQDDCDAMVKTDAVLALLNDCIGPIEPCGVARPISVNPHAGALNIKIRAAE